MRQRVNRWTRWGIVFGIAFVGGLGCGAEIGEPDEPELTDETSARDSRSEPWAGDFVNHSQYSILVWGDNVGPNSGEYGCVGPQTSTHDWSWQNDVDFVFRLSTEQWCKVGTGDAILWSNGSWRCPGGWSKPGYLRYDLRC